MKPILPPLAILLALAIALPAAAETPTEELGALAGCAAIVGVYSGVRDNQPDNAAFAARANQAEALIPRAIVRGDELFAQFGEDKAAQLAQPYTDQVMTELKPLVDSTNQPADAERIFGVRLTACIARMEKLPESPPSAS